MPEQQAPIDDRPASFPEGPPIPVVVPSNPGMVAAPAPTAEEVHSEWNTYVARTRLFVDGSAAVPEGGKVPVSHPMVPTWLSQGLLERVDGQQEQNAPVAEVPQASDPVAVPNPRKVRERDA